MSGTPLIEVVTPAKAAAGRDGQGRWVYLGKSVTLRRRVEAVRARPREPLGRGLQVIAREMRQPFLDFVADIGAAEPDAVSWWSTTFSWKVWGASDLFLLVCYLKAAQELIDEALEHGLDLTLVVEDEWLAHQIADANAPRGLRCRRRPLAAAKIGAVVLGTARRLAWLGQTVGSWRRQRRFTGRAVEAAPRATAAIYTYPMTRCLRDAGGYADALLPGMDDLLRECGHRVMFFSPPERGGFEAELAARRQYFRPLILDSSVGAVIRSLFAMWRPRMRTWPLIAGLRVDHLARREFWRDAARAQWCRYRHFYECARKMLTDEALEWVVFPFENQPWEKLLVLAARERGVRTAGVQHSTLATTYLSFFPGRGEASRMPLPDAILISGTFAEETLAAGGYSAAQLKMTGSMRYQHLSGTVAPERRLKPAPTSSVLVGLPIDRPMAEHLLAALAAAFPDGGRADGITFLVKPHPMTPLDPAAFGLAATTHAGSIDDAFSQCGTVVYVGSTVGPEAAAHGRRVLRYASELLLDVDVSEPLRTTIPATGDHDLRTALLNVIADRATDAAGRSQMTTLFSPVNWDALRRLFRRPAVYT